VHLLLSSRTEFQEIFVTEKKFVKYRLTRISQYFGHNLSMLSYHGIGAVGSKSYMYYFGYMYLLVPRPEDHANFKYVLNLMKRNIEC